MRRFRQQAGSYMFVYRVQAFADSSIDCFTLLVSGLRIICAAFSAIINVGEQVLPEVMRGMIEASAMRRPGMPWTLSLIHI